MAEINEMLFLLYRIFDPNGAEFAAVCAVEEVIVLRSDMKDPANGNEAKQKEKKQRKGKDASALSELLLLYGE